MEDERTWKPIFTAPGWEEIVYSRTVTLEPGQSTKVGLSEASYDVIALINGSGRVKWAAEVRQLRSDQPVIVPRNENYEVSSNSTSQLTFQVFGVDVAGKES
jgi:hypothetical protein